MGRRVVDLVVIGAGIGGLTAAALAANEGRDVLVLEAHNRPGGCAGDFALGGLLFPAGATVVSGFEPEGLHTLVYRQLGIRHRAQPLERAMEIVSPDDRFSFWTDRSRWDDEWRAAFGGTDERGKDAFFRWAERLGGVVHRMAGRLPVLPPRRPRDVLRLAAAFRPETARALPDMRRTVGGVMRSTGADRDPRFRRFIDAQLLDATGCTSGNCAAVNGAIALDLYHRGCFALPGGTAEIALDLARALRRDGGELRYMTAATAIRRTAMGWRVRTAPGEEIAARTVIANVPAWDMPALLEEDTPRSLRGAHRLRGESWGAFLVHAAVAPDVLPAEPHAYAQTLPPLGTPLDEGGMCFLSVLPARRAGGPRPVSISTHTRVRPWWEGNRDAYAERKARYTETLLDAGERAYPGFRCALVWVEAATPRTFARYTGRGLGLVGGTRQSVRHALLGSRSHRSGAPGLYLCGDSVFPGQGTIGVTLSGINAWRSARDDLDGERGVRGLGLASVGGDTDEEPRTRAALRDDVA